MIPSENFVFVQLHLRSRSFDNLLKADNGWFGKSPIHRPNYPSAIEDKVSFSHQDQPHRSFCGANVEGGVIPIKTSTGSFMEIHLEKL